MAKVSARWNPRFLTSLQRQTRCDLSRQMLTLLEQDEEDFLGRLVTMDESWIYMYDQETKEMSKEWKLTTSFPPKKAKLQNALKKKHRDMLTKGVRLLADTAPAHSSQAAVVEARRCGYEVLPHPPYSPDLALNDFFLLPEMKNPLRSRRLDDTDDVIQVVEQ
ncbi:histone-lysine N-methyltransferase SETMAR-like [Oratosquilla oratoria]|uniref:histone-lysine N-methyltransferase SETMAR-like n=1 Tax=Oratosquilla oratoria TaxID=337810 RepID=UPI003F77804A